MKGLLQLCFLAAPLTLAISLPVRKSAEPARALYFITNNEDNAVVSMRVNADGTLSEGTLTLTGGKGESAIKKSTNMTAGPDSLFSQGAVAVSGRVCYNLSLLSAHAIKTSLTHHIVSCRREPWL